MIKDRSFVSRLFVFLIHSVLIFAALSCIVPFIYIFFGSFTSSEELIRKAGVVIFPSEFTLESYGYIFKTPIIFKSILIALGITIIGTFLNIFVTTISAYALSQPGLPGIKYIMWFVLFPMIFQGGMIPTFLIVKMFGLIDSYWALILPSTIMSFNLIVMRNFFKGIPKDFQEAATIDGCNEFSTFFRIMIPLSTAAIATFTLLYAVMHWNSYLPAILYINIPDKWPLQVWLRQIVILSLGNNMMTNTGEGTTPPMQSIKFAVVIVATVPILIFYPFIQKYFAQGLMVGSIKG